MGAPQKHESDKANSGKRPGVAGSYIVWLDAGKDFIREWRTRPRYEMPPLLPVEVMQVIAVLAMALVLATVFDAGAVHLLDGYPASLYRIFAFITDFGKSGYLFFFTGIVAILALGFGAGVGNGRTRTALYLLAARATYLFSLLGISGLAAQILKRVGRARPRLFEQGGAFQFDPSNFSATWASFPSGHTVTAFAFALGLGYFLPKWRNHLLFAAAVIGLSRVMLGAHYLSDVVGGAFVGLASAYLLQRAYASRAIVFTPDGGRIAVRGGGVIVPALRKLARV